MFALLNSARFSWSAEEKRCAFDATGMTAHMRAGILSEEHLVFVTEDFDDTGRADGWTNEAVIV